MSKETAILGKLFAGFDAGYYDLPQELLARRRAESRVLAELNGLSKGFVDADPAAARSGVVAELIKAAGRGDITPGYEKPFLEAQETTRVLAARQSILSEARAELAEQTPWFASRMGEEILADYLRPAMEAVLDRLRPGAHLASLVPWDNQRALVMSDRPVREYHELASAALEDYQHIRTAQRLVMTLTGHPSEEAHRTFGELKNMTTIWPTRNSGVASIKGQAPWPDGPARMAWLVSSAAEPWLPTAAECDALLQERIEANPLRGGVVAAGR